MIDRAERGDLAVILHPEFRLTGPDALDEFQELGRSAGADIVGVITAPRDRPDARFYVGSGKIEELAALVEETGADGIELNFGCPHGIRELGIGSAVGQVPE